MDEDGLPTSLELTVLLAVLRLGDAAYGMSVLEAIRDHRERALRPTVYETLRRLEAHGLLASELGEPLPERGGRARRYYRLNDAGREAIRAARVARDRLWSGADDLLERV